MSSRIKPSIYFIFMIASIFLSGTSMADLNHYHKSSSSAVKAMPKSIATQSIFVPTREPTKFYFKHEISKKIVSGNILQKPVVNRSTQCIVDFNNPNALMLTQSTLWFDRVYSDWYQYCGSLGYIQIKPLVNQHFHLGFEDTDVVFCPTHDQAYPSRLDENGNCEYVDILQEPRTYITTHSQTEVIDIRVYDESGYLTFNLNQLTVVGVTPIRFCYKKEQNTNGPWILNNNNDDTTPGVWQCWNQLDTGTWDLSEWVNNVVEVKISATNSSGSFSIENIYFD